MIRKKPSRNRGLPIWLADAITKCLSGAVLGLLIALVVLPLVRIWFPALEEWSIDRGMRLGELMRPVGPRGREVGTIAGYVFIDVDQGGDGFDADPSAISSPSELACKAIADLLPRSPLDASRRLECASWRPVNRYMLSELVGVLRARDARLIVLDVDLSAGGYPLPAKENTSFIEALRSAGAPAIAILPAQPLAGTVGNETLINVRPAALGMTLEEALRIAAPALPYRGDRIRRYVDCYRLPGTDDRIVPSVTTRSEELLHLPDGGAGRCARTQQPEGAQAAAMAQDATRIPPRILFTLPSLPAEVGPSSSARDSALFSRYHQFYDRCLAADLAKQESPCAQASLFKDKVIVVGASSRARGDRHLTPFGEMAGAEVVLNALRSTLISVPAPESTALQRVGHELIICVEAAFVWLLAFILLGYIDHGHRSAGRRLWLRVLIVVSTICIVLWVSVAGSFSIQDNPGNLDLMVPVLAFGLQTYTDAARHVERMIERPIRSALLAFGIANAHQHE